MYFGHCLYIGLIKCRRLAHIRIGLSLRSWWYCPPRTRPVQSTVAQFPLDSQRDPCDAMVNVFWKTYRWGMPTRQPRSKNGSRYSHWDSSYTIQVLFDTMRFRGASARQMVWTIFWFANHAWNEDTQAEYAHCEPGWRYGDWQGPFSGFWRVFVPVWRGMWNVASGLLFVTPSQSKKKT